MLFIHEVHRVMGAHEDEFEACFRDQWMAALGETDDARLLYFMRLTHGTGRAYNFVTLTAVRDGGRGDAWCGGCSAATCAASPDPSTSFGGT